MTLLGGGKLQSPVSTGLASTFKLPLFQWNGGQRFSSEEKLQDAHAVTLVIGGASISVAGADLNSASGGALSVNGIAAPVASADQDPPLSLWCRVEYGDAAATKQIDFDWCAGSYNLPPCNFVRVTAGSDGGIVAGASVTLNAYVREGEFSGGAIPTYTFNGAIDGIDFKVPEGARALELASQGSVAVDGNGTFSRDDTTSTLVPPWSPLRIVPGARRSASVTYTSFDPVFTYTPAAGMVATDFRCVRFLLAF